MFLTENELNNYLFQPVRVINEIDNKKINNIQEWTNNLNFKYSTLQRILIEKSDIKNTISIKNISTEYSTIIGLVREIKEGPDKFVFDIEDVTGSISVSMAKNTLIEKIKSDDVVAISGRLVGSMFEADALIWPDMPLKSATKGYGKIVLLSDCKPEDKTIQDIQTADYVVCHNCTGWEAVAAKSTARWIVTGELSETRGNVTTVRQPCLLEVAGLMVLVYFGPEQASDVLRRRHITIDGSDFIIDVAPDIVFTATTEPINYKGVTIIGNGMIDAANREVTPWTQ